MGETPDFERLWTAWSSCPGCERHDGATDDAVAEAGSVLGWTFPDSFRALYRSSDGMNVIAGNLMVEPLGVPDPKGTFGGLVRHSDELRRYDWPIPSELLIFGSDGSDSLLGCWMTATGEAPVVMTGEPGGGPLGLAVVGTSLVRFLTAWTAHYAQVVEAGSAPLDVLEVPASLRSDDPGDDHLLDCLRWADPDLPFQDPDPYDNPVSEEQIRGLFG